MRLIAYIIFFSALLLLGSLNSIGQYSVIGTGAVNQLTYQKGGYGADSVFGLPIRDTFCNNFPVFRCKGRITIQPSTGNIYYHDGVYWRQAGSASFDSTSMSQRIDSIVAILGSFVKYTDTAAFLFPYLRKNDTAAMLAPYARTSDVNIALLTKWGVAGNALSTTGVLGTTTNQSINFSTNNIVRGFINAGGGWVFGASFSTMETLVTLDNDQSNTIFMGIGRGSIAVANNPFIYLGAAAITSNGTDMTIISGSTFKYQGAAGNEPHQNTRIGARNIFAATSQHFTTGGGINNFTTGNVSVYSFITNGNNIWNPTTGSANFILLHDERAFNATGTASGINSGVWLNPTITGGTYYGYRSSHNSGRAYSYEGTAPGFMQGIALFNTTTNNGRDRVQVAGTMLSNGLYLEPTAVPATPSTGVVLYVDQADGAFKCKKSTGAVTTIVP